VARCLVSDVPLGAFLSGGIDSSLVVALMTRELKQRVKTFSIGFTGAPDSEHQMAREASAMLGCEHHERCLEPDVVGWLPRIAAALDEPLGDTSCLPTFLLSAFAREEVTVALSGDGGDELFGGYQRYRETLEEAADWRLRARYLWWTKRPWRAERAYFGPRLLVMSPRQVRDLTGPGPGAHAGRLLAGWMAQVADPARPLVQRLRRIDVPTYLPGAVLAKVDRMSMAHALEVRAPMLDRAVAGFAAALPAGLLFDAGVTKPVLRALAARYLPPAITRRRKLGFGVPDHDWARAGLLALCHEVLLSPDARVAGVLERRALERFVARQGRARRFVINPLWSLLVLELWLRAHPGRP
jgi:asparagine synthase (glutamine-hydrolysing)